MEHRLQMNQLSPSVAQSDVFNAITWLTKKVFLNILKVSAFNTILQLGVNHYAYIYFSQGILECVRWNFRQNVMKILSCKVFESLRNTRKLR